MNAANTLPEGYYLTSEATGDQYAGSQTEALAEAKKIMDRENVRGLFEYRPTQSRWLIDEYLDAHPSIAKDVEQENQGFFSRLFG